MKDPKRVAAGKKAALTRYGAPATVHIGDLPPAVQELIRALIAAAREHEERHP